MSDTPETDEAQFGTGRVSIDFARRLERERDEAREETIRTREFMDYGFAKAQEELTDMTAQRDRLAAVLQQCREDSVELVTERDRINAIIASVEARQK